MKIKIDKLEHILGKKIKKNYSCVGFDTATRTGICSLRSNTQDVYLDWFFLEFKDAGNNKVIYKRMVETFDEVLESQNFATIEQVYVGFNSAGSIELARYGSFAIAECIKKEIDYELISAVTCRAKFNIVTTKKAGYGRGMAKKAVSDWLENKLNIKVDDEDISDAIILALCGLIKDFDFEAKAKAKGKKK